MDIKNKIFPKISLFLFIALFLTGAFGAWDDCPDASGDAIISSNATWSNADYTCNTIIVTNNSTLTLDSATAGSIITINTGSFTVDSGSTLSAKGKGFSGGFGTGVGEAGSAISGYDAGGGGAGYGGLGGRANANFGYTQAGGTFYGSVKAPVDFGSGGGNSMSAVGGKGGGAIKLISDLLTLNGTINVTGNNGGQATEYSCANPYTVSAGGGSGGSFFAILATMQGNGAIFANGGNGLHGSYDNGGGGAGGRISIVFSANNFSGDLNAFGGTTLAEKGGPGTIFLKDSDTDIDGNLYIDGDNATAPKTPLDSNVSFDGIQITNKGLFEFRDDDLNCDTLELTDNAVIYLNKRLTCGDVSLASGSTLTSYGNEKLLDLNLNDFVIESTAKVSLKAKGFDGNFGPGVGEEGTSIHGSGAGGGGAGYGGLGGGAKGDLGYTQAGGTFYGSVKSSDDFGSGGGNCMSAVGGAGGGAAKITVNNTFLINGTVDANGSNGGQATEYSLANPYTVSAGGGSGGSIWINAGTFSGNGAVYSVGGNGLHGASDGGGGAGGRIAIGYNSSSFTGDLNAFGGTSSSVKGGSGTVLLKNKLNESDGNLHVNGNGSFGPVTPLDSNVFFDEINVSNYGLLQMREWDLNCSYLQIDSHGILYLNKKMNCTIVELSTNGKFSNYIDVNSNQLEVSAQNFTINSTASINLSARGYDSEEGPGAGGHGTGIWGPQSGGGGAGHGGVGGNSNKGTSGGPIYGSAAQPVLPGSGGGDTDDILGGRGGGAIKLSVSGTAEVAGSINVNGGTASSGTKTSMGNPYVVSGGGGSGGSILLQLNIFDGAGAISSNGGNAPAGTAQGGGGAGGRIQIEYITNNFSGTITATGGSGANAGSTGSDNLEKVGPSINVYSPNGGEQWIGNQAIDFNVSEAQGLDVNADIYYSVVQGAKENLIVQDLDLENPSYCSDPDSDNTTTNNCSYSWFVPTSLSGNYYVDIEASNGTYNSTDSSDSSFEIIPWIVDVNVVSPNGNETIEAPFSIDFNVSDSQNDDLNACIYYSVVQGAKEELIVQDLNLEDSTVCTDSDNDNATSNQCSYSWDLIGVADGNYVIDINISNTVGVAAEDSSDANFIYAMQVSGRREGEEEEEEEEEEELAELEFENVELVEKEGKTALEYLLKNSGGKDANDFEVKMISCDNEKATMHYEKTGLSISPLETITEFIENVLAFIEESANVLYLGIDFGNSVEEENESNNSISIEFTCEKEKSVSDVRIISIVQIIEEDLLKVKVRIQNKGAIESGKIRVDLFRMEMNESEALVDSKPVESLKPEEIEFAEFLFNLQGLVGGDFVIEVEDEFAEKTEFQRKKFTLNSYVFDGDVLDENVLDENVMDQNALPDLELKKVELMGAISGIDDCFALKATLSSSGSNACDYNVVLYKGDPGEENRIKTIEFVCGDENFQEYEVELFGINARDVKENKIQSTYQTFNELQEVVVERKKVQAFIDVFKAKKEKNEAALKIFEEIEKDVKEWRLGSQMIFERIESVQNLLGEQNQLTSEERQEMSFLKDDLTYLKAEVEKSRGFKEKQLKLQEEDEEFAETFTLVMDPENNVDEDDESNNSFEINVQISDVQISEEENVLPDLVIADISSRILEESIMEINLAVSNIGSSSAENFTVSIYKEFPEPENLLHSLEIEGLAQSGSSMHSFEAVIEENEILLLAVADSEQKIDEENESNNALSVQINGVFEFINFEEEKKYGKAETAKVDLEIVREAEELLLSEVVRPEIEFKKDIGIWEILEFSAINKVDGKGILVKIIITDPKGKSEELFTDEEGKAGYLVKNPGTYFVEIIYADEIVLKETFFASKELTSLFGFVVSEMAKLFGGETVKTPFVFLITVFLSLFSAVLFISNGEKLALYLTKEKVTRKKNIAFGLLVIAGVLLMAVPLLLIYLTKSSVIGLMVALIESAGIVLLNYYFKRKEREIVAIKVEGVE